MKLNLTHEQQARTQVVTKLAPNRDQPSLCGFEKVLPSAMGRLFEKEFCVVSGVMESPERLCVFVLGGAKVSDAFLMMETVLSKGAANMVLTGKLVGNILIAAKGEQIGSESLDFIVKSNYDAFIASLKELLDRYGTKIILPLDRAYLDANGKRREAMVRDLPMDAGLLYIGAQTAELFAGIIRSTKTVFVNGPMGVFEKPETEHGTKTVWQALAETEAYTVLSGGDSITAMEQYGFVDRMGYICTGDGALIRFLTGEELPVVRALRYAAKIFPAEKPRW